MSRHNHLWEFFWTRYGRPSVMRYCCAECGRCREYTLRECISGRPI